jgi:hypothetical protein
MAIDTDLQKAYEARIDALFVGAKAKTDGGAIVLPRADVLSMLKYPNLPVEVAEGKVFLGQTNHFEVLPELWKKAVQWLENPAIVFRSENVPDNLVFYAPEKLGERLIRLIIEPEKNGKHLLLNLYSTPNKDPFGRWMKERLLLYADTKEAPRILGEYARRLRHILQDPAFRPDARIHGTGRGKQKALGPMRILTEKNLSGYRKAHPFDKGAWLLEQQNRERSRQEKMRMKQIDMAKALYGRYVDMTNFSPAQKNAMKKQLNQKLKESSIEEISFFIKEVRENSKKIQEKRSLQLHRNIGKNRGGDGRGR